MALLRDHAFSKQPIPHPLKQDTSNLCVWPDVSGSIEARSLLKDLAISPFIGFAFHFNAVLPRPHVLDEGLVFGL